VSALAQEVKVNAFIKDCGQSLDWIFDGDLRGMICRGAGNSPQAPSLQSSAGSEVEDGLFEMESPVLEVRNLAMAARMMGSADSMPKEPGAALDALADTMVTKLDALSEERGRLWKLARKAGG
jgi:hypothetical protein